MYAADGSAAHQYQRRPEVQGTPGGRDRRGTDLRLGLPATRRGRGASVGEAFAGACAELGRVRGDRRGHHSGGGMNSGIVYTETVVHAAPEQFVADAPYQLAIVSLEEGGRLTVRVDGDRVAIGDRVDFLEDRNDIPFFRKA